jgi:hypothetical protein
MDFDLALYDHCAAEYLREEEERREREVVRREKWGTLARLAGKEEG